VREYYTRIKGGRKRTVGGATGNESGLMNKGEFRVKISGFRETP
jgi:hypothetical protein